MTVGPLSLEAIALPAVPRRSLTNEANNFVFHGFDLYGLGNNLVSIKPLLTRKLIIIYCKQTKVECFCFTKTLPN